MVELSLSPNINIWDKIIFFGIEPVLPLWPVIMVCVHGFGEEILENESLTYPNSTCHFVIFLNYFYFFS